MTEQPEAASGAERTDELFPVVYEELKRMAPHHLRRAGRQTICTTELVREADLEEARGRSKEAASYRAIATAR